MVIQKTHYEGQRQASIAQFRKSLGGISCGAVIDSDADAVFRVMDIVIDKAEKPGARDDVSTCGYYDNFLAMLDHLSRESDGYVNVDANSLTMTPEFMSGKLCHVVLEARHGAYGFGWYLI